MKKFIILLFLLSTFVNICSAEIVKQNNNFDKSTIIYIKSKSQPKQLPRFYIFKKYTVNNKSNYFLSLQNQNTVTNTFNNCENAKIKFDDNEIITVDTFVTVDARHERQATLRFNQDVANKILNCSKIEIQLSVYFRREHEETSYFYALVPTEVIDEWKQVINM